MTAPFCQKASSLLSSFGGESINLMTITAKPLERTDGPKDTPQDKPKKARCEHADCKARLGLLGFDCKCGAKFCSTHRHPESHNCDYDHKTSGVALLSKQLIGCVGDKMSGGRV